MRIDVFHHFPADFCLGTAAILDEILGRVKDLQRKGAIMSIELDELTVQVEANTSVERSAIVLLQGIAAQLADAKDDPVKIAALSASLRSSADELAAAITANTPAEDV